MAIKIVNIATFRRPLESSQSLLMTKPTKIQWIRESAEGFLYMVARIVNKGKTTKGDERIIVVQARSLEELDGEVTAYWLDQFLKFAPYRIIPDHDTTQSTNNP